jgi:hypothetical protein
MQAGHNAAEISRAVTQYGKPLFFHQPSGPILRVPAQAGYGDKWPS